MTIILRDSPSPSVPASEAVPKEALYAILIIFLLALSLVMYAMARVAKYWGINRDVAREHIVSIVKAVYRTLGTYSAPGLAGAQYPLQTFPSNLPPGSNATAPSTGSLTPPAAAAGTATSGLTPSTAVAQRKVVGTSY